MKKDMTAIMAYQIANAKKREARKRKEASTGSKALEAIKRKQFGPTRKDFTPSKKMGGAGGTFSAPPRKKKSLFIDGVQQGANQKKKSLSLDSVQTGASPKQKRKGSGVIPRGKGRIKYRGGGTQVQAIQALKAKARKARAARKNLK